MKTLIKVAIWIGAIAALLGIFFASNIKGYYRFKEICEKEGGLRVYQSLERDVGWQVLGDSSASSAKYLLHLYSGIDYVRYQTSKGEEFDIKRKNHEKDSFGNLSYLEIPSTPESKPKYVYFEQISVIENLQRTQHYKTIVAEMITKRVLAEYRDFVYRPFSIDWGYGGGMACSTQGKPTDQQPNRAREAALSTAFIAK